jgi:RNA polymerase sigma-70 factor, ECF subfamily
MIKPISETPFKIQEDPTFKTFYTENYNGLFGFVHSRLGNYHDTQEVMGEVCLISINCAEQLRDPKKVKSWLYSIANNQCLTYIKKRNRNCSLDFLRETLDFEVPIFEDSLEALLTTEKIKIVRRGISNLKGISKQVLELSYYEGIKDPEIAEELNLPLGTIKSRLARARIKLRELLLEQNILEYL